MLLLIVLILATIISFTIAILDEKFWNTDVLGVCGFSLGIISGIATFIICVVLIIVLCDAPKAQAKYEECYNKILYKVKYIDSYNFEDINQEVNNWNETYRINTYGKNSPWVGIFYMIDTSATNLIELNGGIK